MDGDKELAELRELLLRSGAEPRDLTPLPGQQERMERSLAAIVATPRDERSAPTPLRLRSPRQRRTALTTAAVVATAAAISVVLVLRPGDPTTPAAQAGTPPLLSFELAPDGRLPASGRSAAAELERLASLRAGQPTAGSGAVQHVSVDAWWAATVDSGGPARPATTVTPVHTDSYFFPDATLRVVERRGVPLTTAGRIDEPVDLSRGAITSDESFPSPDPGPRHAAVLPTTAAGVRARLARDDDPALCGDQPAACLVNDMIDLHRSYVVPPDVDAALWGALAREPGIRYLGRTTDRVGRAAVAFTTPSYDAVSQIVVFADPTTGAFLGDELVLVAPSPSYALRPPAVTSFSAVVEARWLDAAEIPR